MKKIIICILMIFCLVGCGEKKEVDVHLEGISFDADIVTGKFSGVCRIEISSGGLLVMEAKSPESIAGTRLTFDGEKTVINYKGLEYIPELPISNDAATEIINKILRCAASGDKQAVKTDEGFLLTGEVSNLKYSLYVTEGGLPLSLSIEKPKLYAEFSNVKMLNK